MPGAHHPKTAAAYETLKAQSENQAILVDFSAQWCSLCKRIAPLFEELALAHPSMVFIKVDVDHLAGADDVQDVTSIPMFKVFKGGAIVDKLVGGDFEKLRALVKKHAPSV